jgi:Dihydrodipicolinate reductase, N-terminus
MVANSSTMRAACLCCIVIASYLQLASAFVVQSTALQRTGSSQHSLAGVQRASSCRRTQQQHVAMAAAGESPADIYIMMNGLPGNMGKEVAAACLRKGFSMAPYALTGADVRDTEVQVDDMQGGPPSTVQLIKAGQADVDKKIEEMKAQCGAGLICIDYTHPSAVNGNAELYAKHKLNFVMGTTGGDRQKLLADTEQGGAYAVIAPNMGKQVKHLQSHDSIFTVERYLQLELQSCRQRCVQCGL